MQLTGSRTIHASRHSVWDALNDPELLGACITGCESIERTEENQFLATVSAKVGPVKAKFTGVVTLSDLDPPNGYKITGEGKGGAAGFVRGGAEVRLEEVEGGTELHYTVDAQVGGKLAQIGSRLIGSVAKKNADEFFDVFTQRLNENRVNENVLSEHTKPEQSPELRESKSQNEMPATKDQAFPGQLRHRDWLTRAGIVLAVGAFLVTLYLSMA